MGEYQAVVHFLPFSCVKLNTVLVLFLQYDVFSLCQNILNLLSFQYVTLQIAKVTSACPVSRSPTSFIDFTHYFQVLLFGTPQLWKCSMWRTTARGQLPGPRVGQLGAIAMNAAFAGKLCLLLVFQLLYKFQFVIGKFLAFDTWFNYICVCTFVFAKYQKLQSDHWISLFETVVRN